MKHVMFVIKEATGFLNPYHIPVTVCDQPFFAITKVVQWNWPASLRENVHIVKLGCLHIEMVLWAMCGDLLAASGWTTLLTEAGISSSGTLESWFEVAHLTKTRRAHQIGYISA